MIYGMVGQAQSGKDTCVKIWQLLDIYYNTSYYSTHKDKKRDIQFVSDSLKRKDSSFLYNIYSECCELGVNGVGYIKDNSQWQQKAFATKLKQIVCIITGCTMKQFEDINFKNSKVPEWLGCWKLIWNDKYNTYTNIFRTKTDLDEYSTKMVWEDANFYPIEKYYYLPTYRELLQYIGTDLFRDKIHLDIHINMLMQDYKLGDCGDVACAIDSDNACEICNSYPKWLISDVRFLNETKAIKDRGGKIIKISRYDRNIIQEACKYADDMLINDNPTEELYEIEDGVEVLKRRFREDWELEYNKYLKENQSNHQSETELEQIVPDYIINNNSDISYLIQEIKNIMIKEKIINENSST